MTADSETQKPLVSITLSVYNGEKYIDRTIRLLELYLSRSPHPFEIIVVDNGSNDGTRFKALKTSQLYDNVKVVGYKRNRGKGVAFLYDYMYSRGDIIVLFDSDLDIPPKQILLMLKAIERKS